MRYSPLCVFILLGTFGVANAASRPHVISFGKWMKVQLPAQADANSSSWMELRGLFVDAREKAFTTGSPHDITGQTFVVQQAVRLNDDLPGDKGPVRWIWQRGGWLLVNQATGRISAIHLPEFDPEYSGGSWYRDYFAYCGVAESGRRFYAMVVQLGRRSPLLKEAAHAGSEIQPLGSCQPPAWQRQPIRVTFHLSKDRSEPEITFQIGGNEIGSENHKAVKAKEIDVKDSGK